jgi:hypothetical protein
MGDAMNDRRIQTLRANRKRSAHDNCSPTLAVAGQPIDLAAVADTRTDVIVLDGLL